MSLELHLGKRETDIGTDECRAFTIVGGILWCVMESIGELATLVSCQTRQISCDQFLTKYSFQLRGHFRILRLDLSIQLWASPSQYRMGIVTLLQSPLKFLLLQLWW